MALIMYLTRAPRYKNTTVKEIQLIENYFAWQHEKEIGSKYGSDTFEKWCGHSESELPDKTVIDYYKQFYTKKAMYVEHFGTEDVYSLFEQMARLVKTNQIFNWFINNIMHNKADKDFHEVTKEQLESLLNDCKKVKDSAVCSQENQYVVNEETAKTFLPLLENGGYFFGTDSYDQFYINQVVDCINIIEKILNTTDFEKQTIYFNATW